MTYEELRRRAIKIDKSKINKSSTEDYDKIIKTADKYNSAIESINVKNFDIAKIKLKKVIGSNPDFSQAIEVYDALKKYEESQYEKTTPKVVEKETLLKKFANLIGVEQKLLLNILIGIAMVIIVILLVLSISAIAKNISSKKVESDDYTQEDYNTLNTKVLSLETEIAELNNKLTENEDTINNGTIEKVVLEAENEELNNALKLYMAKSFLADSNFSKSTELILTLDANMFNGEDLQIYSYVKNISMTESAKSAYSIGNNLFNKQDFAGALENFLLVHEYDSDYEVGQTLYNLGKTYYELGDGQKAIDMYKDIELNVPDFSSPEGLLYNTGKAYIILEEIVKAKEMFNNLIDNYPTSSLAGQARSMLSELE